MADGLLSDREREILNWFSKGKSTRDVAVILNALRALRISPRGDGRAGALRQEAAT